MFICLKGVTPGLEIGTCLERWQFQIRATIDLLQIVVQLCEGRCLQSQAFLYRNDLNPSFELYPFIYTLIASCYKVKYN